MSHEEAVELDTQPGLLLGCMMLAAPLAAQAQQPTTVPPVKYFSEGLGIDTAQQKAIRELYLGQN